MPRAVQSKPYLNFTGGLVTEATGLTYPENTARDMNNVTVDVSGRVARRLALVEELDGVGLIEQSLQNAGPDTPISFHPWPSPGGDRTKDWIVIQIGNTLYVRDLSNDVVSTVVPSAGGDGALQWASLNKWTNNGEYTVTDEDVVKSGIVSTVGLGRLWFAGSQIYPFYLEYDPDADEMQFVPVGDKKGSTPYLKKLEIRDFQVLASNMPATYAPSLVPPDTNYDQTTLRAHIYDLLNAGWPADLTGVNSPLLKYSTKYDHLPSANLQWILGKNADDDFDAGLLGKQDFGDGYAPRGRAKLHALEGDRDRVFFIQYINGSYNLIQVGSNFGAVTQINGDPADIYVTFEGEHNQTAAQGGSFRAIAFHAGRLWLSGDNNPKRPNGVYFSQVIQDVTDAGKFYQSNDPTSEHFYDLYDDDGGVIYIPEANDITALKPFLQGVLVFSENGIWYIRGGEAGFTAAEYSVDKISNLRCKSPYSIVEAENTVYFWTETGIHAAVTQDGITASITPPLSNKIETFYNKISVDGKSWAQGCYDQIKQKVVWMYNPTSDGTDIQYRTHGLEFDVQLQAFTPFSTAMNGAQGLVGCFYSKQAIQKVKQIDGTNARLDIPATSNLLYLWFDGAGDDGEARILEMAGESFYDYAGAGETPVTYSSYIETGDEHGGDISRNKQATYVTSVFEATEREVATVGEDTILYPPSKATVTFKWDWHTGEQGGRWSNPQQAYRRRRPISNLQVDNGASLVYTRLKARGKGKALSIRYESEDGYDFILTGFNVEFTI